MRTKCGNDGIAKIDWLIKHFILLSTRYTKKSTLDIMSTPNLF